MTGTVLLAAAILADFVELGTGWPVTTNRPYCGS